MFNKKFEGKRVSPCFPAFRQCDYKSMSMNFTMKQHFDQRIFIVCPDIFSLLIVQCTYFVVTTHIRL